MSTAGVFLLGCAVGAIVALVVIALAQSAGRTLPWQQEDAARAAAQKTREQIEKERQSAHDIANTVTPEELNLVLAGRVTFGDIVRGRTDPASPFFRPGAAAGGEVDAPPAPSPDAPVDKPA